MVYIQFLNFIALFLRSRPLFILSNLIISCVSMLNLKIYWLNPSDHPPPKMYIFLPSLTAAAFEMGNSSLVLSMVQLPVSGLQTSIELNLSLPSQPPKTQIFPPQTVAAKAHRGTLRLLACFHSYLNISQYQQPAMPLFLPSQPLIAYTFPLRYTQECYFLELTILFFFSRMLGSLGLNRKQWLEEPPPVMKIYPVGSVHAEAQYWIQALFIVVRLQTPLMGHKVNSFFLSPKKQILGLTLWHICTKLSLPVNGITRTGNQMTVGFLYFLIWASISSYLSSAFFYFQICSSKI